ncbi:2,3-bisphosphoglycerate-independent phosphoglycerate mutase [candidate division GN15 bacterium]|nr:2,3-bisphosphoglycerate-independent phosphoglycerate mutase [candidate division GN15 bacterium]
MSSNNDPNTKAKTKVLLCIMDGFGLREETADNAVAAASKPNYDQLAANWPHTKLDGSAQAVGLPEGQMGNSEVGHLNLGAGRVVYQDITRIDKAIEDGSFFENEVLVAGMERVALEKKAVHLFGLVSDGKVHSSLDHIYALVQMAKDKGVEHLFLHAFMDGRDTSPTSGKDYLKQVMNKFDEIGLGKVATVGGRYYGMDRDRRWERTSRAYNLIIHPRKGTEKDPLAAIQKSYDEDITDEFIVPLKIHHGDASIGVVTDGDLCIQFNFRADRMRQLAYLLSGRQIEGAEQPDNPRVELVTMTNYDVKLFEAKVAFHPVRLKNILGEVLSRHNLTQLRTAETEKYAHVTFFFNGGVEEPFPGEDREMVPSPKVATYDLQPAMSSVEVTDKLVERIEKDDHSFILVNYANCDMVGHTGDFDAAKKAVEAVDTALGRILEAIEKKGGVAIVSADHGNAELMKDPSNDGPWTAHTTNLVPCIVYDPSGAVDGKGTKLRDKGILADIAPTVLDILGLDKPEEMTGESLIVR